LISQEIQGRRSTNQEEDQGEGSVKKPTEERAAGKREEEGNGEGSQEEN
jgi:hypothetical protein